MSLDRRRLHRQRAAVELQAGLMVLCAKTAGLGRAGLVALIVEAWAQSEAEEDHVVDAWAQKQGVKKP